MLMLIEGLRLCTVHSGWKDEGMERERTYFITKGMGAHILPEPTPGGVKWN